MPSTEKAPIALLFAALLSGPALAEIIPADRKTDWTPAVTVGVPGGIPDRQAIGARVDAAKYGTGSVDAAGAIGAAIDACPPGKVVFIPAGTYRMDSRVYRARASQITVRGAGMGKTVLKANSRGQVLLFGTSDWPWPTAGLAVADGATKGNKVLTVADASSINVGNLARIEEYLEGFSRTMNHRPLTRRDFVHGTAGAAGAALVLLGRPTSGQTLAAKELLGTTFELPTPMMVSIHGGGFSSGNKAVSPDLLEECLKAGISVAAITYRLSGAAAAPAQFLDSARAIQFIRSQAKAWNLDPSRIAASGGSAGAGISLWLGFHDDLADSKNADPVLRQSTRLTCMAVFNAQTSYDPRFIRELFPGTDTYKIGALAMLFRMNPDNLDQLPQEKYKLFEECSPLTHLTKDDAPALLVYSSTMEAPITNQGVGIHHARFGKALKEKMDALGVECQVQTGVQKGSHEHTKLTVDFVKRHFKMK